MITLYGIPNCDTVKRARRWFEAEKVAHRFHDFRKDGIDAAMLVRWARQVGFEALLNRKGMTWRKLDESERTGLDEKKALALMLAKPTVIKRPVIEMADGLHIGFAAADAEALKRAIDARASSK